MSVSTIRTHLINDSALSALVSDRVYRKQIPQNSTFPLILFNSTDDPQSDLDGSTFGKHYEVEFEVYAPTLASADAVVSALNSALGSSSDFSSACKGVADDDYIDDTNNYSIFLDYSIWF